MAYAPFDFNNIPGYPNMMPKLKELPIFTGQDAVTAAYHWDEIDHYILTRDLEHLDMKFKCFASSLKYGAREWWNSLPATSISTWPDLKKSFFDRWQEKKDLVLLNNALMSIKRNDNETTDKFDHRFDKLIKEFPDDCKPPDMMILSYYLNAFPGDFIFHLGLDKPQDLVATKKKVKALDELWRVVGRLDTSGHSRAKPESKKKAAATSNDDQNYFSMLLNEIEQLRVDVNQQIAPLQNIIVQLERERNQQLRFPPRISTNYLSKIIGLAHPWNLPMQ